MIYSILSIMLLVYSCFHFKKGFLIYLVFQIFWYPSAKLFYPNITTFSSIPLYLIMSLGFAIIYFFKENKGGSKNSSPYFVPLALMTLSHFFTCLTALEGFESQLFRSVGFMLDSFIEIVIIWKTINGEKDVKFLFRWFTFAFLLAGIYGISEYFLETNFVFDYKSTLTPEGLDSYITDTFRGYRVCSIFEHPIGSGMNFGLYLFFSLFLVFKLKVHLSKNQKMLVFLTDFLSVICIILSKMRTCILFAIVACLGLVNIRNKKTIPITIFIILATIVISLSVPYVGNIFLSFFNSESSSSIGGSSFLMRLEQIKASFNIMNLSPLLGLGERFSDFLSEKYLNGAYGFESVWFETADKYGILGLLSLVILIYYSLVYIPIKYHSKIAFFISLAYWLAYSFSSVPFFRTSLYYCILCIVLKSSVRRRTCFNKRKPLRNCFLIIKQV